MKQKKKEARLKKKQEVYDKIIAAHPNWQGSISRPGSIKKG